MGKHRETGGNENKIRILQKKKRTFITRGCCTRLMRLEDHSVHDRDAGKVRVIRVSLRHTGGR